jgi:CubicO group peptidase (beta-lactamase class C family)
MMLAGQGQLELDAPVRKSLKDFKPKDESVARATSRL